MTKQAHLRARILVATLVGTAVFLLAIFVAWRNGGPGLLNNFILGMMTRGDIRLLDEAIQGYVTGTGSPPASLSEIRISARWFRSTGQYGGLVRRRGTFLDGWGRPYLYSVEGTNYLIVSYGRDGVPDGKNPLDADISSRDPHTLPRFSGTMEQLTPSFRQFLFELPSTGMVLVCLVCGVLAFSLCMATIKPDELDWREPGAAIARIIAIVAVTVLVSFIHIIGHIPSGH